MKFRLSLILLFFCNTVFANDLQYVRVQLEWKYQFEFAGFIAAKELGYYQEVGLDVDLVEYEPSVDNVLSLIQGDADYGFVSSAVSILRAQNVVVQNLEQTQRFVDATNRGWEYAL
jgi:ABC-type nitrate/sulfonate/bicarbonate transport system substrate-binding protein